MEILFLNKSKLVTLEPVSQMYSYDLPVRPVLVWDTRENRLL